MAVSNSTHRITSFAAIGSRCGLLTVIGGPEKRGIRVVQLCRCDCGKEKLVQRDHLLSGNSTTCGCRGRFLYHNGLTATRLRELFHYDPETGIFTRLIDDLVRRHKAGEVGGNINVTGYVHIGVDGRKYRAHRLAWLYMTGEWPTGQIDHDDEDRSNNRFANLKDATQSGNMHNQRSARKCSKSGIRGVSIGRNGRPTASLRVNNKVVFFKRFTTVAEAAAAYDAARIAHGLKPVHHVPEQADALLVTTPAVEMQR